MKVYVKTSSIESSDVSPYGIFVHYTITDHAGPFDSTHEAVKWALDGGYEGFEILEFKERNKRMKCYGSTSVSKTERQGSIPCICANFRG